MRYNRLSRQYNFNRNLSDILDENLHCPACRNNTPCPASNCPCNATGLAIAKVPMQKWREIYEEEKGFCIGTIFSELNMPFVCSGRSGR